MRGALLPLVLAMVLAGCSEPGPDATETGEGTVPPSPSTADLPPDGETGAILNGSAPQSYHVVFHQPGYMDREVETKLAGAGGSSSNWTMEFPVGQEATAIVVELVWDDSTSDLDPALNSPNVCDVALQDFPACLANAFFGEPAGTGTWRNDDGLPGQNDSPARILVTADEWEPFSCARGVCDFTLLAWAKLSMGTDMHLYATVFYGELPAEDYTAIPPGS